MRIFELEVLPVAKLQLKLG